MWKQFAVSEIKQKGNVRVDMGDLTELTASIRDRGVLQPLIVQEDGTLVDGHRRLAAAKAAGLKMVPVQIEKEMGPEGRSEMQLETVLHRKDLTPIEEAQAYAEYMKSAKCGADSLAAKVHKREDYVDRRLQLVQLDDAAKTALQAGKIQLGHAQGLLAMREESERKKLLDQIISQKMGVADAADASAQRKPLLKKALFDVRQRWAEDEPGCVGCPHNGAEAQQLLGADGADLSGHCLDPSCYRLKTNEVLQAKKAALEKEGKKVFVLWQGKGKPAGFEDARAGLTNKDYVYDAKVKQMAPELVVFEEQYDYEWDIEQYVRPPKRKGEATAGSSSRTSRPQQLASAIRLYRHHVLLGGVPGKCGPDRAHQVKALAAWALFDEQHGVEADGIAKGLKVKAEWGGPSLRKLLALDDAALDGAIASLALLWIPNLGESQVPDLAAAVGFDLAKDWRVDEAFLKMHRKAELVKLGRELGGGAFAKGLQDRKYGEMVQAFLKDLDLKGVVPKSMAGGKR